MVAGNRASLRLERPQVVANPTAKSTAINPIDGVYSRIMKYGENYELGAVKCTLRAINLIDDDG
jgi:hypothetical protein